MKCANVSQLLEAMHGTVAIQADGFLKVTDPSRFYKEQVDLLAENASIGPDPVRDAATWIVRSAALDVGAVPSSIHELYLARGRGEVSADFTVPAINIRGMSYDTARAVIRSIQKRDGGAFIYEIARSEIGYTDQKPAEYAAEMLCAAMREEFHGPVFIQGDHFQVNAARYRENPDREIAALKSLISEAIAAGFYNIDIDSSTVVDLTKRSVPEQQELNYRIAAELTAYIRSVEPEGVTVSVGGEIGEVGGRNSTVEELEAFMDGYNRTLKALGNNPAGLSKLSVQSGTTHGGVVLPDGTIADVAIDFDTLETLSRVARENYGLAGAVQHGASTLPDEAFNHFPARGVAEVHLATAFQNIFFDSVHLPDSLKREMYAWLDANCATERKADMTGEQFYYKTRKKAFGAFKEAIWNLDRATRKSLSEDEEDKFDFLFAELGIEGTQSLVQKGTPPVMIRPPMPEALRKAL